MRQQSVGGLPLWQFDIFSDRKDISHFVSGRAGGVSKDSFSSLNLSYNVGDEPENVSQNRRRIAYGFGISPEKFIFPAQTHSTNVRILSDETLQAGLECTDALITSTPGICIAVLAADCVPVLIFDPVEKVVAAVHSGWRGTVGKILLRTIESMQASFQSNFSDLLVGIGPSISRRVYEIGEEVIDAVHTAFPKEADELLERQPEKGKALLDLWKANELILLDHGVPAENIEISNICTLSNREHFFSARAARGGGGRFAAGIMLSSVKIF